MFKKIDGTRKQCFLKSVIRFTDLLWECILLSLLLCSASGASCLSRATGCLSELSCGGRLSFYVYLCVCVYTMCLCTPVCTCVCVFVFEWRVGAAAGRGFFSARPPWGAPTPAVIDALLLLTVQRPEHRDPLRLMFICGQKPPRSGGPGRQTS